ncbi:MAG TPA: hypothetical protein PKN33_05375 [Phycisphaerae bacterium]|nr:hypothetical protein [Phycisphaerae bacterium]
MNPRLMLKTVTAGLLLTAGLTPANAADLVVGSQQSIPFSGTYEDFTIPTVNPPTYLRLTVFGGDGGGAETNADCFSDGGEGGTAEGTFRVGYGANELEPGGTIRFIVGEKGQTSLHNGSGGGGSGVIYRAPGVTSNTCGVDWIVLVAAGAGGGGTQKVTIVCGPGHTGGDAQTGECGGTGGGSEGGAGGCNGQEGDDGGDLDKKGSGGAGAFGGHSGSDEAKQGCPTGGQGGSEHGDHGGWGFGGGGSAYYFNDAGGGGGGYSGGGGGHNGRQGAGGGSFISEWAINQRLSRDNGGREDGEGLYLATSDYETCVSSNDCNANGVPDDCDLESTGRLNDFENGVGQYTLGGSATLDSGYVKLTPAATNRVGKVIFNPVLEDAIDGFSVEFDYKMGGGTGANGMSFVLIDADVPGEVNPKDHGDGQPLALSLDTYEGNAEGGNHAEILSYGVSISRVQVAHKLDNNEWQHALMIFEDGKLTLVLDDGFLNTTTVFDDLPVPGFSPIRAKYGFGARTGAATNNHLVDNVRFRVPQPNNCNGNGIPDECESDVDGDLIPDDCDFCPNFHNDGPDADGDTIPDGCDTCPNSPNIRNRANDTYYTSIKDAINEAESGDVIELGECVFFESGLELNDKNITLLGASEDSTIIDGGSSAGRLLDIKNEDTSTIRNITLRNSVATGSNGGAALAVQTESAPTFRRCRFLNNDNGSSNYGAVFLAGGSTTAFHKCVFTENTSDAFASAVGMNDSGTSATFVNSLFHGNGGTSQNLVECVGGSMAFVNCTFANSLNQGMFAEAAGGSVEITNCVHDATSVPESGIAASYCLFPGATGNNVNGLPEFVDASNGDFRLAGGSLGIDAANLNAYGGAGASSNDLNLNPRLWDDTGITDTGIGIGPLRYLDMGAFEFQGTTTCGSGGDFGNSGTVDLYDYRRFSECASGPAGGIGTDCACFDLDSDGDVDARDFAEFQKSFTGS